WLQNCVAPLNFRRRSVVEGTPRYHTGDDERCHASASDHSPARVRERCPRFREWHGQRRLRFEVVSGYVVFARTIHHLGDGLGDRTAFEYLQILQEFPHRLVALLWSFGETLENNRFEAR